MDPIDILKAREERINNLKNAMEKWGFDSSYVIIKSNYPGREKTNIFTIFLVNYFKKLIFERFKPENSLYFDSFDGPYYITLLNMNGLEAKKLMVEIEEENEIGRLIDLDVYYKSLISISRKDLNRERRKCIVCNNDPIICSKLKKHDINEIKKVINDKTNGFLFSKINEIIKESILTELNLDPKFGLVTPFSQGSHNDMDYDLMASSIEVVSKGISELFLVGYHNNINDTYEIIRNKGLEIEKKMLNITNGINTYKGLIFVLGFISASLGNYIRDFRGNLISRLKQLANRINDDFNDFSGKTFGEKAYLEYGIRGARGIVIDGVPLAFELSKSLKYDKEDLIMTLAKIISQTDDTVLLKRCNDINKYNYYKDRFKVLKYSEVNKLTKECIKENLSFGGSADVLIATIFLNKVKDFIDYE